MLNVLSFAFYAMPHFTTGVVVGFALGVYVAQEYEMPKIKQWVRVSSSTRLPLRFFRPLPAPLSI